MSGLIIFPACAAYGIEPDAGPSLIFITLPRVFVNMSGGRIWGTLFFLFMTFASFSTVTAVFENLVDTSIDNFGTSRMKAVVLNCIFMIIASMPCVLGYNVLAGHTFIGARDVLDSEDFIVSNILLPGGSIIFTLFCTWKAGWGFDNYRNEANKGAGIKVAKWLKPYLAVVLPLMVLFILINGLLPQ
jgi:NSS family neurotransmitter:Na+ symporter